MFLLLFITSASISLQQSRNPHRDLSPYKFSHSLTCLLISSSHHRTGTYSSPRTTRCTPGRRGRSRARAAAAPATLSTCPGRSSPASSMIIPCRTRETNRRRRARTTPPRQGSETRLGECKLTCQIGKRVLLHIYDVMFCATPLSNATLCKQFFLKQTNFGDIKEFNKWS